jgi:hypothetical protein
MNRSKPWGAKRPGRLAEVLWVDSCSTNGWQGKKAPDDEPVKCLTAGYLISRTKRGVTLAMNSSEYGSTGEWMTIPASCVVAIKYRGPRR